MAEYEECIKDCDEAVARGRELRSDYALIGRAMQRKGNALVKLGRLQEVRRDCQLLVVVFVSSKAAPPPAVSLFPTPTSTILSTSHTPHSPPAPAGH